MRTTERTRRTATAVAVAGGMLLLSACGAADTGAPDSAGGGKKTVRLTVPSWVGAEANVAVAKHLLESELGYKVKAQQMGEVLAWDALSKGNIDAILEDWGHPEQEQKYIEEKKTVVRAGDLGVTGHIGWFVPKYFADENPDVTNWKNLNKYADELSTSETGSKGQILEGSPDYVTNDEAIIKNLDLDFKAVYAGSEAAQITEIRKNVKDKKPFLTYWWTPQWLNAEIDLVEVELPEYKEGCDKDPKKVACAYPNTPLQKFLNADFAENGGEAAEFLKNLKLTTEQQNEIAKMIAGEKMSPEAAAEKWTKANPDVWKAWMP
ncbi:MULTISPECIES: ABC transporter substrate-binding protein [Streptomyces]|uniref:Glycine/betaine ABC transporter substrate-binding protein n=2 Tax=Streptomyces TaxID=1883 RepID=A0A3M8EVS7_9ACTN|nr:MULTISPECIES: ABC transporter substrate-binding protein [Streptomyces]KNE79663.1 glycine/betaine ABC transporter substrate-binding protein [Streptomyces fradiae]OFA37780.1 glycine/betaine ABC transporter substrate-binding protein [Streptomyces fradiae]PQM19927.1 glycine/betaine ABC transporter substrate-binding protein [Streptomyces xinghaiensis]RKM94071.1 glycine/betaine ABC transporter substrate-binding protein [Streptomyces xinghaiensis]RNC69278.1 glycine/betaine ABC transporter substrat